jgi:hypothetical protein
MPIVAAAFLLAETASVGIPLHFSVLYGLWSSTLNAQHGSLRSRLRSATRGGAAPRIACPSSKMCEPSHTSRRLFGGVGRAKSPDRPCLPLRDNPEVERNGFAVGGGGIA